MRRMRLGCGISLLLSFLLLLTIWSIWCQFPRVSNEEELARIVNRPRSQPGGVRPVELPWEASAATKGMVALGTHETPKNKHLPQLIGEKDPDFLKVQREFEDEYEHLRVNLARGSTFSSDGYVGGVNQLQDGLNAYAEVLLVQGRDERAQAVAIDGLRLAQQLRVIHSHYAFTGRCMLQRTALDTVEYVLVHGNWDKKQLQQLSQSLRETVVPDSLAAQSLEEDIASQAREALLGPGEQLNLPGLRERHTRIYQNRALDMLSQLRTGQLLPIPSHSEDHSLLGKLNHSNLEYGLDPIPAVQRQMQNLMARQGLDHLWAASRIYRLHTGSWPQTLAELHYQPLPGFDLSRADWKLGPGQQPELTYPLPAGAKFFEEPKWAGLWTVEGASLKLSKSPSLK